MTYFVLHEWFMTLLANKYLSLSPIVIQSRQLGLQVLKLAVEYINQSEYTRSPSYNIVGDQLDGMFEILLAILLLAIL